MISTKNNEEGGTGEGIRDPTDPPPNEVGLVVFLVESRPTFEFLESLLRGPLNGSSKSVAFFAMPTSTDVCSLASC